MAERELLAQCIIFNDKMKVNETIAAVYKKYYCLNDNSRCARYMVFMKLGRESVPKNLLPNMIEEVNKIPSGK